MVGVHERLEGAKARREVRQLPASERSRGAHVEMDGFDGLSLKTISSGWFSDFGCKIGGRLSAVKV